MDYLKGFNKAVKWIIKNSINGNGIAVLGGKKEKYPEVTGYYIPTLLNWGYRDLAFAYAEWLCSIQNQDGSWNASDNSAAYVFDSAQILKGLIAANRINSKYNDNIRRGCDWIISNMHDDGRLTTPDTHAWGDGTFCSELIHIYCLSPLYDASQMLGVIKYKEAADKILNYYLENFLQDILNMNLLSHFYAYIVEGLMDVGKKDIAMQALDNLSKQYNSIHVTPGVKNVEWVCSTGLFQLSLCWFKVGNLEEGNRFFEYACSLQNRSGGWYGSYAIDTIEQNSKKNVPAYFPQGEISWAVKYYLDALQSKLKAEFNDIAHIFSEHVDSDDGRYLLLKKVISQCKLGETLNICDVGCGKGRYLFNLQKDYKNVQLYAVDISDKVMQNLSESIKKKTGTLVNVPYEDDSFDIVYTIEALEHAVHVENAVNELIRVTKKGGIILIIDKKYRRKPSLELEQYEQWIKNSSINRIAKKTKCRLEVISGVPYEGKSGRDGLFNAWIITK